ncbi:BTB/POZ domain-containing protein At3g22104-like isoform X2 [Wolffia australiana]
MEPSPDLGVRLNENEVFPANKPAMAEKLAGEMISTKREHSAIARFLLHYLRAKSTAGDAEKTTSVEAVVGILFSLSQASVTCKSLFGILNFISRHGLPTTKLCRTRLEKMIAAKLDEASLDNLLVRGPSGLYDVGLVLRLLNFFVAGHGGARVKKAAEVVDLYLAEVAPEKSLTAGEFAAVAAALPAKARDCHDGIYRAVDIFLQVHDGAVTEEEKERICGLVDFEKLSPAVAAELVANSRFPPWVAAKTTTTMNVNRNAGEREQIVLYARKMEVSSKEEVEKLRTQLWGMQWRVAELEKLCRRLQAQVRKMAAAGGRRALPRLCS